MDVDVVVVGAGAAGIGAGRRLRRSGASFVLLEARDRVGGRALTIERGHPLDLGCEWLHSGDVNIMTAIAQAQGFAVDRSEAPWRRQSGAQGMSETEQAEFGRTFAQFEQRIDKDAESDPQAAASRYLDPSDRWNPLLDAVFSYISGASLDEIDARDYARYEDNGVNCRVREGYGALFAACAVDLPVRLGVAVRGVDHSGARVRVKTDAGVVEARCAILTLPTSLLPSFPFTPDLPRKREAALALPLGAAEKVHFALEAAEEFPVDGHLFGRTDAAQTGSHHLRPLGRPLIATYFGGALARQLAAAGADAMAAFAKEELASLLGSGFPRRLTTLAITSWSTDVFARGSYSYAKPGCADMRAALAAPEGERLFFAGEACSRGRYSTAHGAFETGYEAAGQALAALGQLSLSPRA